MADNIFTSAVKSLSRLINLTDINTSRGGDSKEIGVGGEQMIRSQGTNLARTLVSEEIRQDNLKITDYRRMMDNDGQVQMIINAIFNTILSPGVSIVDDPEYESEDDSEEKEFIEKNLLSPAWKGGMEISMNLVNKYQLRAFIEGYRIFEVIYKVGPDGKVYLRKLAPRAGSDDSEFHILVDKNGNFMGYKQYVRMGGKLVDVAVINSGDIKKVHRVVYGEEFGSLYGRSGLRAAWYHYDKAHKGLFLNHVGHELGVIHPRLIYTIGNTTEDQRSSVLGAFDRIHLESSIMLPKEQFEVEFPQTTDAAVMAEGRESINMHYSMIAKSVLAQFIDLGSAMARTGSRSLGDSHISFFKQGMESVAKTLIEDPWNAIIADIIKINFGGDIYPTLKVNAIDDKSAELIYAMLLELTKKGDIPDVLKNRIISEGSDKLGIEVSEEEITEEMDQKKAEEQEVMEQQKEATQMQQAQDFEQQKALASMKQKAQKMADISHKHMNMEESTGSQSEIPMIRPLYKDEEKVKLADIKLKLDDTKARAEFILRNKLTKEKDRIVNSFAMALRDGRKAIRKAEVNLADETSYREELTMLASELYEYGKVMAANEIGKPVPQTPRVASLAIVDRVDAVASEQEERLRLKLSSVANEALDAGLSENDTKVLMEQEYDNFWSKVLIPTIGLLIGKMFNKGRQLTFDKNDGYIFAFRYTAVLDARTTQYCRDLDGKVFQATDPNYSLLTPPNHYGCRSMWTPITNPESAGVIVDGKPSDLPVYSSVDTFKDVPASEPHKHGVQLSESAKEIEQLLDTIYNAEQQINRSPGEQEVANILATINGRKS